MLDRYFESSKIKVSLHFDGFPKEAIKTGNLKIIYSGKRIADSLIKEEIDNSIKDVLANTSFIGGKTVEEFERKFAELLSAGHCIGVGNGTDALQISLKV